MRICLHPSLNPRLAKHNTTLDLLCLSVQELFHGRLMPTDTSQCTHHAKVFSGVFPHLGRNKRHNKQPSCFGKRTLKVPASFPPPPLPQRASILVIPEKVIRFLRIYRMESKEISLYYIVGKIQTSAQSQNIFFLWSLCVSPCNLYHDNPNSSPPYSCSDMGRCSILNSRFLFFG